jgi:hypothetical protein
MMKHPLQALLTQAIFIMCLAAATDAVFADELAPGDANARWQLARQLARETNDRELVRRVEDTRQPLKAALAAGKPTDAEAILRKLETAVGIDPGGWSMNGLGIFHPTPAIMSRRNELNDALEDAMAKGDIGEVQTAVADMRRTLGDQAGLPDARRPGSRAEPHPLIEAAAVNLFLAALQSEKQYMREITAGRTVNNNMLRFYADIVQGCCDIRPAVRKQAPQRLAELDPLVNGACSILTRFQQPAGYFPLPDLRGKNIRFGEMTEKLLADHPDGAKDGWILVVDPAGGTQFDTGVCGVALLAAGAEYQRDEWTQAGLRAAEWALQQRCVRNFNYNAFSVSLLAHASRISHDNRHLAGALHKLRLGVAPGQVDNGRWIDAHNARTVYHLIILRALHDLWEAMPPEPRPPREDVARITTKAVGALLDEYTAAGITTPAVKELLRHEALNPAPDPRLRGAIELTASVIHDKCARGSGTRVGVSFTELAALARAWKP